MARPPLILLDYCILSIVEVRARVLVTVAWVLSALMARPPLILLDYCILSIVEVRARVLVTVAWVLSVLMAIPLVILFEESGDPGQKQCRMQLPGRSYWKVGILSAGFKRHFQCGNISTLVV